MKIKWNCFGEQDAMKMATKQIMKELSCDNTDFKLIIKNSKFLIKFSKIGDKNEN